LRPHRRWEGGLRGGKRQDRVAREVGEDEGEECGVAVEEKSERRRRSRTRGGADVGRGWRVEGRGRGRGRKVDRGGGGREEEIGEKVGRVGCDLGSGEVEVDGADADVKHHRRLVLLRWKEMAGRGSSDEAGGQRKWRSDERRGSAAEGGSEEGRAGVGGG
jgi:hypothetical protein